MHLCHRRLPSEARGGIGFWLGNANGMVPGDGCDTGSHGVHLATAALSPELVCICSRPGVASICLAAAAVMALLLGYGLVTFPEMRLQAPRRPPLSHNLPGISPCRLCNASSKCSNLVCELGFGSFLMKNVKKKRENSFISVIRHVLLLVIN